MQEACLLVPYTQTSTSLSTRHQKAPSLPSFWMLFFSSCCCDQNHSGGSADPLKMPGFVWQRAGEQPESQVSDSGSSLVRWWLLRMLAGSMDVTRGVEGGHSHQPCHSVTEGTIPLRFQPGLSLPKVKEQHHRERQSHTNSYCIVVVLQCWAAKLHYNLLLTPPLQKRKGREKKVCWKEKKKKRKAHGLRII